MNKVIENKDFESALANLDNKLIMDKACASFRNIIERDELYRCKLVALWEAMQKWNPQGRKFTSFLYQKVRWECLKVVQIQKKQRLLPILRDEASHFTSDFHEMIEILPLELQDILVKRYIYNMTLREISQFYGTCHETTRRKINRALEMLKNHQKS